MVAVFFGVTADSVVDGCSQVITKHAITPDNVRLWIVSAKRFQERYYRILKALQVVRLKSAVRIQALLEGSACGGIVPGRLLKSRSVVGAKIDDHSVDFSQRKIIGLKCAQTFISFAAAKAAELLDRKSVV